VLKSNIDGKAHFKISLGSAGFAAGVPGVINGFGVKAGLLNAEVKEAVPPHVKENPYGLLGI
jgi:hypothetical protein